MSTNVLLLARDLNAPFDPPVWPDGFRRVGFSEASAPSAYGLLADGYTNGYGTVDGFAEWHTALVADEEYAADHCFLFEDDSGPAAFALVWTSGFIKDFAVAERLRRQGIGRALLLTVFADLHRRGHDAVRLKVHAENHGAVRLYKSCGMAAV